MMRGQIQDRWIAAQVLPAQQQVEVLFKPVQARFAELTRQIVVKVPFLGDVLQKLLRVHLPAELVADPPGDARTP